MQISNLALAAIALVAAAGASPALAKHKDHGRVCHELRKVDPDNDGSLTLDEALKAATTTFDRLNRDKDNTLDKRELRGRLHKRDVAAADPDKDGTLDKNEYLAVVKRLFAAANPDKDNTIECKELKSRDGRALMRLLH